MSRRTAARSRGKLTRVLSALVAVGICSGAVAYAASRPADTHKRPADGRKAEKLPQASFIEHPEATTTVAEPQFRFHVAPRSPERPPAPSGRSAPGGEPLPPRRFQCRLDGGEWKGCGSPHRLAGPGPGDHHFAVRAFTRDGRPGPAAGYSWQQLQRVAAPVPTPAPTPAPQPPPSEPEGGMPFTIEQRSASIGDLYPGDPAQPLSVVVSNPNPVAIEVTGLSVAIAGASSGCTANNFELIPSSASPATPLPVPADGSVSLPTATVSAPSIALLELPVNQDACQGADIALVFSGEARG